MAYTLANLQTDIRNYTEVDDTVFSDSILDPIIKNAENRIYREADSDDNRFYATSTLVSGNRYVTIPSDLRIIRYVQLKDTNVTPNAQSFLVLFQYLWSKGWAQIQKPITMPTTNQMLLTPKDLCLLNFPNHPSVGHAKHFE